jgi:uncharacterized integral membrane protein
MWFVKAILAVLLLAALLYFALLNSGQSVDIHFTSRTLPTLSQIELPVALLGSVVVGMLLGFLMSLFQVIAAKSEVAGLRRRNRELTRELTDLRNMPVKDLDPDLLPGGETMDEDDAP